MWLGVAPIRKINHLVFSASDRGEVAQPFEGVGTLEGLG